MDNKKNLREFSGIKVSKLNRATSACFNELYNEVKQGTVYEGFIIEIVSGDVDKLVISLVKSNGVTEETTPFGKAVSTDIEDYDELVNLINSGNYISRIYDVDNTSLVLLVKEKEEIKDLTSGYNTDKEIISLLKHSLGEKEYEERIEYLKEHGITEGSLLYTKILEKISPGFSVHKPVSLYKKVGKGTSLISKILSNIVVGNNLILQGPKSVGKNVAWESVAWLLNCNIVTLQCSERLTRADMLGFQSSDTSNKELLTEEGFLDKIASQNTGIWTEKGISYQMALDKSHSPDLKHVPGPVLEAMIRANRGEGIILLVDEMNLADPNTLAGVFNTLTDKHSKSIFVTGYGEEIVPKHLIIGATQNANTGNYIGVNAQNTATVSRFTCIDIKETGSIKNILQRVADEFDVPEYILDGMNKVYCEFKKVSDSGEDGISSDSLNIRGFESAVRLIGVGVPSREAIIEGVINTVSDYNEIEVLIQLLDNFVEEDGNFKH